INPRLLSLLTIRVSLITIVILGLPLLLLLLLLTLDIVIHHNQDTRRRITPPTSPDPSRYPYAPSGAPAYEGGPPPQGWSEQRHPSPSGYPLPPHMSSHPMSHPQPL
ncbi:hypothetical protein BC829DRAFT_387445, partial [Chytridium lagenaria]